MANLTYKMDGKKIKLFDNGDGTYSLNSNVSNMPSEIGINNSAKAYLTKSVELLTIPTPDGTGYATHPSVVRFRTPWNGYRFWMAFTPYASIAQENPCIVASNDGVTWIVPTGVTNPLFPMPATEGGYNSDTELIYLPTGNKLRMYFREYSVSSNSIIWYTESTDGIIWSEKIACTFDVYKDAIAPSIIKLDKYYMYIGNTFGFYESVDGIAWTNYQPCITDIEKFGIVWHPQVWADGTKLRLVSPIGNVGKGASKETELYYAESTDGINWTFETHALYRREPNGKFDQRVYRSCVVPYGSEMFIYMSGLTSSLSERIGYSKLKLNS